MDYIIIFLITFIIKSKGILILEHENWVVHVDPLTDQKKSIQLIPGPILNKLIEQDKMGIYRTFELKVDQDCQHFPKCTGEIISFSHAIGPHEL